MNYYLRNFYNKTQIDWGLFFGVLALAGLGLIILYSAKPEVDILEKQGLRLLLAGLLMLGMAQVPPRIFKTLAPMLYFSALFMLVAVLVIGDISKGGQRWLDLKFIRFQPAELMKLALPLMVARVLEGELLPPKLIKFFIPSMLIAIPVLLVAKQPDLGTALLMLSSGVWVIFFSGIRWQAIFSIATVLISCLPLLWYNMYDYQRERVFMFLDPQSDPLGAGYQIIQSKIAIGSGGLYGKGWMNGSQSHLEFLPERTTDCIFAVFGEEFGLVGCLILLGLYLYIIMRGLYISVEAQDTFSRLLAGSIVMTLFIYIFVNIGMVTGILPVVGIPLPLVSYGGTSLVTLMASFGMLMSIHTHKTLLAK
jgi:rod shape determining protein RodA